MTNVKLAERNTGLHIEMSDPDPGEIAEQC